MRTLALSLALIITLASCSDKKSTKGDKPAGASDFFDAYKKLELPFTVTDSTLKDIGDTSTIAYSLFTSFIPDTIFNTPFGKDRKITLHPIGKIEQKNKETYFATLAKNKSLSAVYLSVYDSNKHMVTLPMIVSNPEPGIVHSATIDPKLSITISNDWVNNNEPFYSRNIYAYNNVGIFTTVLTETNDPLRGVNGIPNPFDTLMKKNKYSGEYKKNNKNVVYITDGNTPDTYLFYVHFDNENEDDPCDGELKGKFKMINDKTGEYSDEGDPCSLSFKFSGNQLQVKENGNCGNYRGIKCFFNDTYTKKKEVKASAKKK